MENLKSGNMGKIRKVENWKRGKVNLFLLEDWKIGRLETFKVKFFLEKWKIGKVDFFFF